MVYALKSNILNNLEVCLYRMLNCSSILQNLYLKAETSQRFITSSHYYPSHSQRKVCPHWWRCIPNELPAGLSFSTFILSTINVRDKMPHDCMKISERSRLAWDSILIYCLSTHSGLKRCVLWVFKFCIAYWPLIFHLVDLPFVAPCHVRVSSPVHDFNMCAQKSRKKVSLD